MDIITGVERAERAMMSKRIFPITMPKWGIEMQQGTVTGWHVAIGQAVEKGEHLLDVETEKIVNSVEAPISGTLRLILADTGATENVGALIGVFADSSVSEAELKDFVRAFKPADASFEPAQPQEAAPAPTAAPAAATAAAPAPDAPDPAGGEGRISPIARRVAQRLGVDISKVAGTGRGGRISKEDVEAYAAAHGAAAATAPGAAPAVESVRAKMSSMRSTIARRLLESTQSIPHYRLAIDVHCGALLARVRESSGAATPVSLNDLLTRAAALSLKAHPLLNSHLVGEEIITFPTVDICVAVATDNGLLAPVIRAAEAKTAGEIGAEIKDLAQRARAGTLTREEISGGTFTISNLGMFGVDRFDAIINPPQVAILAVGAVAERPIARQGVPAVEKTATLTLSADHRVIDGAVAARFLASLKSLIELPQQL